MASKRLCVTVRSLHERLQRDNFTLERQVGSHEQWRCPRTNKAVTLSIHGPTIRGDQVKSIYEQAGWPWKVEKSKPIRKPRVVVKAKRKVKPVNYKRYDLEERVAIVEYAQEHGDIVAAEKFNLTAFNIAKWRGEFGDCDGSAAQREWRRRAFDADMVAKFAKELLEGVTANRLAAKHHVSLHTMYIVAKGKHRNLDPDTAVALKDLWQKRQTTATYKITSDETIADFINLIMHGTPVRTAAKQVGISENLATRISMGRHASLTQGQKDWLATRPRQNKNDVTKLTTARALRAELQNALLCLDTEKEKNKKLEHRITILESMLLKRSFAS